MLLRLFEKRQKRKGINEKMARRGGFDGLHAIESIEDVDGIGHLFSKDGMVYRCYKVKEPERDSLDGMALGRNGVQLGKAYGELPQGAVVTKIGVKEVVGEKGKIENDRDRFFSNEKTRYYYEKDVMRYRSMLLVGLPLNETVVRREYVADTTIFSGSQKGIENALKNVKGVLERFDSKVQRFTTSLASIGVRYKEMDASEIELVVAMYFNLDWKSKHKDLVVEYSNRYPHFLGGNKIIGITSMAGVPATVANGVEDGANMVRALNYPLYEQLKFPHVVVQTVKKLEQDHALAEMEKKAKLFSGESYTVGENIMSTIEQIKEDKDSILKVSTNVIYTARSEAAFEEMQQEVGVAFKNMADTPYVHENTVDIANIFFSSAPGCGHQNYRAYYCNTLVAGFMTNFVGEYYSHGNFHVKSRTGEPLSIMIEPEDVSKASNFVVGAPTGGGKSFFMNVLCSYYMEKGDEIFIVDKNRSYEGLCKLLNGIYYDCSDLTKLNLPVFQVPKGDDGGYIVTNDKKSEIIAIIAVAWKKRQGGKLTDTEEDVLRALLSGYYQHLNQVGGVPKMDTFIEYIKGLDAAEISKMVDVEISEEEVKQYFDKKSLVIALNKFHSKNNDDYCQIFNHEEWGNEGNRFQVFDIGGLDGDEMIRDIVIVGLMIKIRSMVYGRIEVRKHILLDETSEILDLELGRLIRILFREIRKENGNIGIIVQLLTDLTRSVNGPVILGNAQWMVFLDHSQAKKEIHDISAEMRLTDHEREMLESLNREGSKKYREAMFKFAEGTRVYRIEEPEILRMLYSTEPGDKLKTAAYIKEKGGNVEHALAQYKEDYGRGRVKSHKEAMETIKKR
jgi:hypothetical protein